MYTLKILASDIVTVLETGTKLLSVLYEISKDGTVLHTQRQGFPLATTKDELTAALIAAKEVYAADNERALAGPAEGQQVAADITEMTSTEL